MIGTILLAAVVAFASGLGTKAAEDVGKEEKPAISYSVATMATDCVAGTFLPVKAAEKVLQQKPPVDWRVIEDQAGAVPVGRDPVEVDIQGESERKVTLTGIAFHVHRLPRPSGTVFYDPCGGPTVGRSLEVNLETRPPRILNSSAEADGMPTTKPYPRLHMRPIRFPWTVSLTDPLLLEIVADTKRCYCSWSAEIPWVSGAMRGVIHVDDGGKGFTVADGTGLHAFGRFPEGWQENPF
ncbi:MAG: hypothetical protein ACTHN7_11520 [Solirubrobacterales bacterium]